MIRGWLAMLVLMAYGLLAVGSFAVLAFHSQPVIINGVLSSSSTDLFYPIALLFTAANAMLGAKAIIDKLNNYAWDHR